MAKVAFSQVDGPLIGWAAVGGTPLVSLAVAAMGCGAAAAARQFTSRRPRRGALVAAGLALLVPVAGGLWAGRLVSTAPEAGQLVGAVQGNVPRAGVGLPRATPHRRA